MARRKIPTALAMRALKYGEATDAERDEVAGTLRNAGRRAEAVLLFAGRPEHPFLRDETSWAVSEGEAFHLLELGRLGREISPEELGDCARKACERGRWMDARLCYVALGDEKGLASIDEHLPPTLRKIGGAAAAGSDGNGNA